MGHLSTVCVLPHLPTPDGCLFGLAHVPKRGVVGALLPAAASLQAASPIVWLIHWRKVCGVQLGCGPRGFFTYGS